MEARLIHLSISLSIILSMGAIHQTPNFTVTAPTQEIAVQAGKTAERYRSLLAKAWLDKELPTWSKRCTLKVKVGQIGAGGATTFQFHKGHVYGWNMTVQGSLERVLDSVIPHEVSHTIFASYFRRPLPRWADEGAATLIEHESEKRKQQHILKQVFNTSKRIPLNNLLKMKEYPKDRQDVYTLYAEGYSLADFLVQAGGKKKFLHFLETAHHHGWTASLRKHYNLKDISILEKRWNSWIIAGSPDIYPDKNVLLASASRKINQKSKRKSLAKRRNAIIRGQNTETRLKSKNRTSSNSGNLAAPKPLKRLKNTASGDYSYTLASQKRWQLKSDSPGKDKSSKEHIKLPIKSSQKSINEEYRSSSKIERYKNSLPLIQLNDIFNEDNHSGDLDFPSSHDSDWTDFPQRRKGHGAAKLGKNSIDNPSS